MKYRFRPTGKIYDQVSWKEFIWVDSGYDGHPIKFEVARHDFRDYFEEVQESELIPGNWYCVPDKNYYFKYLYTHITNIISSERFDRGIYHASDDFVHLSMFRRPATSEELAPLFDAEAKRRGFVKGAEYKAFVVGSRRGGFPTRRGKGSPVYDLDNNSFGYTDESGWVYQIGQWADLIKAVPNYHQQFEDSKYALRNIKKIIEDAEKRVGDFNAE